MKYTTLAGYHREQSVLLSRCAETTGQRRDYPEATTTRSWLQE